MSGIIPAGEVANDDSSVEMKDSGYGIFVDPRPLAAILWVILDEQHCCAIIGRSHLDDLHFFVGGEDESGLAHEHQQLIIMDGLN